MTPRRPGLSARLNAVTLRQLAKAGRWLRAGRSYRGQRKAVILVITLWIVVVLGMIASSLAFDVQVGSKLTLLQKEQFVAYNLAKSAVAVGMTHLQNDMIIDYQENPNQPYDAISDVWGLRDLRDKEKVVEVDPKAHPDRTYQLEIVDEESKIPLNTANFKVMKAMMEYYGFQSPDSDDIAYAIIDYRDQDDQAAGEPGAYENEFYSAEMGQRVKSGTDPDQLIYRCPNEAFLTTDQILDVYGFSQFPQLYYGFDPEEQQKNELEMRDAVAAGRRIRSDRGERETSRRRGKRSGPLPMKDILTVTSNGTGNGKINLNTASVDVLTILIHAATNFESIENAKAVAEAIADYRGDNDNRAPDPEKAFKSAKDLAQVPGINMNAISQLGSLGIQPVYASSTFRIIGTGDTNKAHRVVEVIVDRHMDVFNPDDARLVSNKGRGIDKKRREPRQRRERGSGGSGGKEGNRPDDNYIRVPSIRVLQWID